VSTIGDYRAALSRLIENRPVRVPRSTKISNDAVSLEAGRKRGTIKRSRNEFIDLIDAIQAAAKQQRSAKSSSKDKIEKLKLEKAKYRKLYKESLGRELMLIDRLAELEKRLEKVAVDVK